MDFSLGRLNSPDPYSADPPWERPLAAIGSRIVSLPERTCRLPSPSLLPLPAITTRASPVCCRRPARARAGYVLAHGAGAGMTHPFMAAVAAELAQRGIATLRYQFPYMERGSQRPDPPHLAHATVRAAVAAARRRAARTFRLSPAASPSAAA